MADIKYLDEIDIRNLQDDIVELTEAYHALTLLLTAYLPKEAQKGINVLNYTMLGKAMMVETKLRIPNE
jgi:hypothetical protein